MSRCELSGKRTVVKRLVSHSNIKTKTVALPNVQVKRIYSKALDELVRFKVATSTIRDMEHMGGLDRYLLNQKTEVLSPRALEVQARIRRSMKANKKSAKTA